SCIFPYTTLFRSYIHDILLLFFANQPVLLNIFVNCLDYLRLQDHLTFHLIARIFPLQCLIDQTLHFLLLMITWCNNMMCPTSRFIAFVSANENHWIIYFCWITIN